MNELVIEYDDVALFHLGWKIPFDVFVLLHLDSEITGQLAAGLLVALQIVGAWNDCQSTIAGFDIRQRNPHSVLLGWKIDAAVAMPNVTRATFDGRRSWREESDEEVARAHSAVDCFALDGNLRYAFFRNFVDFQTQMMIADDG